MIALSRRPVLEFVREHVPAARAFSDGRLSAILLASAVLLVALADAGEALWIGVGVAVWLALRARPDRQPLRFVAEKVGPLARAARAASVDALSSAPAHTDAPDVSDREASVEDPLVARARALRDRAAQRA